MKKEIDKQELKKFVNVAIALVVSQYIEEAIDKSFKDLIKKHKKLK